jgi:hypothetical protein
MNLGKANPENKRRTKVVDQEEYFHNSIYRKYWFNLDKATSKI